MSQNSSAWLTDWMEFQRRYWDALGALNPAADEPSSARATEHVNPWASALDTWWKSVAPNATPPVQDFYARLIEQSKFYFDMAERMTPALQATAATGESVSQWQTALQSMLETMREAFSRSGAKLNDPTSELTGLWELPLENWQRMASSISLTPGDLLQGINTVALNRVTERVHEHLDQFLSAPGVGQMRERQGQYQKLTRLWIDYQRALQDYVRAQAEIGVKSVERLQQRLGALGEENKTLDSLRAVYDTWVDCCEEVYADYVTTDEYAQVHGAIVNALMALKKHSQMMVDEVLGALNMPTRREIETLHSRFHLMKRDNNALRAELEAVKEQLKTMAERSVRTATSSKSRPPKKAAKRSTRTSQSANSGTVTGTQTKSK